MVVGPGARHGVRELYRGMSGMPNEVAMKSPWAQNSSVTRATAGMSRRAMLMPSRTVPVVQLPQCP